MKKRFALGMAVMAFSAALSFAAGQKDAAPAPGASAGPKETMELTLYYSHAADWTDPIIKEFQDRTGVKVNLVGAGTGELVSRIKAEKENPLADLLWGGGSDSYQSIIDLLEPYAHKEMDNVYPETRDPTNRWHGTSIDPMVIIYNPKLVAPQDAPKGWADLINPKFKGKIAHADPAKSGSAFMALIIQLQAMGGDNEKGWQYTREFVANLSGKLIGSSSGTFKGVSDGEYSVGITYEEGGLKYQRSGADLKVVYPAEGSSKVPSPVAIVKGGKNLLNARKFVDFVLSKEVQSRLGDVNRRSVRKDIVLPADMVPNSKIGDIPYDTAWIAQNKDRIMTQWKNLIIGK